MLYFSIVEEREEYIWPVCSSIRRFRTRKQREFESICECNLAQYCANKRIKVLSGTMK